MTKTKTILIFGGGELQLSIIHKCLLLNICSVVIDPNKNAPAKDMADYFYVVAGTDFISTCDIIEKHNICGIATAATDKPLVMMARIAEKYGFPFFSNETAQITTNKKLMKERFITCNIPCAEGKLINSVAQIDSYPVIIKPVDNSGSRGVFYCSTKEDALHLLIESKKESKFNDVLVEKYIQGDEYSVEAIHQNSETYLIQITEKQTSQFPYNVEMGHIAPAQLSDGLVEGITELIEKIAQGFAYNNCVSHTELKIQGEKITVIETSPRLGGDMITSHLVPLSTGFDIETALIQIALSMVEPVKMIADRRVIGIFYWNLEPGIRIGQLDFSIIQELPWVKHFQFDLKLNDTAPEIKSSIDRYGHVIIEAEDKGELLLRRDSIFKEVNDMIK